MKFKLTLLTILCVVSTSLSVFGQNDQLYVSMLPIIKQGTDYVKSLEKKYAGAVVQRVEYDLALHDNFTYMPMSQKLDYIIDAITDDRVKNFTLIVYEKDKSESGMKEVAAIKSIKGKALMQFDPISSDGFAIDVRVDEYTKGEPLDAHIGIFVLVQPRVNTNGTN
jgi:hypothetical protein